MKRVVLNYLIIAAFVVSATLFAAVFTSCDKEESNNDVQLVETISTNDELSLKFEYNGQNRITKVFEYENGMIRYTSTLDYDSDGNLTSYKKTDSENPEDDYTIVISKPVNNKLTTIDTEGNLVTYELNADGLIIKIERSGSFVDDVGNLIEYSALYTFEYKSGNLIKMTRKLTTYGIYSMTTMLIITYDYDDKKSPHYHCKTPKWFLPIITDNYGNKNNVKTKTEREAEEKINTWTYTYDDAGFPLTMKDINDTRTFEYIKK
jgi:YD repeat-containing protein